MILRGLGERRLKQAPLHTTRVIFLVALHKFATRISPNILLVTFAVIPALGAHRMPIMGPKDLQWRGLLTW